MRTADSVLSDVLTACAGSTIHVYAQIAFLYLYVRDLTRVGNEIHGREGGMPPTGSIVGRNADKTMNSLFALEKTVGIISLKPYGHGLDARFFTGQKVHDFSLDVMRFGPAQIHPFQHFRPVLGFRAAGPRVNVQKRVHMIGLTAEKNGHFRLRQQLFQSVGLLVQCFQRIFFALGNKVEPFLHFVVAGLQFPKAGNFRLKAALLPKHGRKLFLIGPGIGTGDDAFYFLKSRLPRGQVKDAPRGS